MKRNFTWLAVALSLACSLAWCQEPTKEELKGLERAIQESAATTTLYEHALFDLSSALIADNGLGIDVAVPEAALRAQLGLDENSGLVVIGAPEESLGAKAGLKVHDVLVQLDDQKLGAVERLKEWLGAADGKAIKLKVLRAGKPVEVQVTPKKPDSGRVRLRLGAKDVVLADTERFLLGVTLSPADETLRAHLRLAAGEGLVVTEVVEGSAAAGAGIQINDVLIVLDGKRLTTVEAVNEQIQEIKDRTVELRLLRSGKESSLQIAPRKTQEAAFFDRTVHLWDTQSCTRCHANPFPTQESHLRLAERLGAHHSVWTDGHSALMYKKFFSVVDTSAADAAAPQQQIAALKTQLAEMQKTLAALESSLAATAKEAEPKEEPKK
jgi:membrane-associated protease RseP (regulator of RpoE activity)